MSCDLTCRQFVDFLDAYIDGELADEPRATFEVHIEACPPCRDYLKSYADTIRLARGACREPDDPPPCDVPEKLVKAILAARKKQP